ncbi:MAG: hypothetical protein M3313_09430, partial [Actinomycetota bacterium]|nr:hypothetical protein [Actinomycetota bacterium]
VVEKPPPDLTWFTSLPDASARTAVALQLLKQGEVSAAEFVAMVLPGFQLHPIEHDNEYQVDMSDAAEMSYTGYLVAIAATTMTPDQNAHADALLTQNKYEEAIRFIVNANPWTSQRYQILERRVPIVTTDEIRNLGAELEVKAQEVGADVADYREGLQAARTFWDTAEKRSATMAANTAGLATARVDDCAPITMDIGAGHTTEVTGFLSQRNMSYAVVSPLSLSSDSNNGDLDPETTYGRKVKSQSVDPAGTIGAFLDGRRKPPPSSQTDWFKTKAELSYATVVIARAAAAGGGGKPPFNLDQNQLGLGPDREPHNIAINLSTISVVQAIDHNGKKRNDVIFQVTLLKQNATLWVRAGVVDAPFNFSPDDQETLEKALKQIRDETKAEPPTTEKEPSEQPVAAALTRDIKIGVAKSREAVETMNLI